MVRHALPVLYTLLLWWFSTGVILYLDGLPSRTFRWSMAGATALVAVAIYALTQTSADTSLVGAYAGFTIGLLVWAWLETGYYMGFMVGPRRHADPAGSAGWARFRQAAATTLYHELAAVALSAVIAAVTWDMPNKVAFWTFLILWGMQLSAKLNVFLGVANLAESFLPPHLAFLRHYMTRKPMNLFFPVSITAGVVLATLLIDDAARAQSAFAAAGSTMLACLVVLAVLEHWFLVLPLPFEALWRWSLASRKSAPEEAAPGRSRRFSARVFAEPAIPSPATPMATRRHP